jgi:esterase/lipase superfamily enzyme
MYLRLEVIGQHAPSLGENRLRLVGPAGLTIGRAPDNGWVFPSPYVSRRHAQIWYADGAFFVEALAANTLAIGAPGNPIPPGTHHRLAQGDRLFLDEFEILVTELEGDRPEVPGANSLEEFPPAPRSAGSKPPIPDEGDKSAFGRLPPPTSAPLGDDLDPLKQLAGRLPSPSAKPAEPYGEWPQLPETLHGSLPTAYDDRGRPIGSCYTVWFGTNRRPRHALRVNDGFEALPDKSLHVGSCTVRIPHTHQPGSVGSPAWRRFFILGQDDRISIESLNLLDIDRFLDGAGDALASDASKRALLYIHGYNTTFEGAAIRAAQIGFDLGIRGVTAVFSWPSHGTLKGYFADGPAVELAEDYFVQFVQLLLSVDGLEHIDILAHSMGNRLLLRTIKLLSELTGREPAPRIRHILLAAPDVDIGKFGQVVDIYKSLPEKWTTIYTCRKDLAIAASTWLHDAKRLGYEPPVYNEFGLDTISASLLPLDWLGHGYFASARPLLEDIKAIIDRDLRPESRKLIPVGGTPRQYWRLQT